MLDFFLNIVQFAFQSAFIVISIIVVLAFAASLAMKGKDSPEIRVRSLNKKLKNYKVLLQKGLLQKKELKKITKQDKKQKDPTDKPRVFVLNFNGDIKASASESLREEVTAILMVADKTDQVVAKIESPGGMVHGYGLAASQLQRIKDAGIPLTACVDKVAASGGYMMASIANTIVAAPFAIVGSIGVVASLPNFNKVLKKNDIDYLEITAGEYKRTLTPLGEITEAGTKKFKEQIESIHELFKNHVHTQRPQVDISQVSTGEYWYGSQAKSLNLVDEIGTSDDHLMKMLDTHGIFEVSFQTKKSLKEKLTEGAALMVDGISNKVWSKAWATRFQ